jgi:hemolysin activation/secretion protein
MSHGRRHAWCVLVVLLFARPACVLAGADEYERIKPKEPAPTERVAPIPDRMDEEVPGDEKVIVQALKGVIFLGLKDPVAKVAKAEGVQTAKVPTLDKPAFRDTVGAYVGQPVSMRSLNRIIRDTILYYRKQDLPLVDVVVPEQDITNGVVQLVVVEGRVGEVKVEGAKWFSEKQIRRQIKHKTGDVVYTTKLIRELESINRNPFRDVNVLFTPGAAKGQTDLIYQVEDRFPVRFYVGYENTGVPLIGEDRQLAGFNWGDAFFQGHDLGFQATTSIELERYRGYSGYYRVPLPVDGHQLTVFGSHASTETRLDRFFNVDGTTWQIGIRYQAQLPQVIKGYTHYVQPGFDFKRADSDLAFGGLSVYQNVADIAQFTLEYGGVERDRFGHTTFALAGSISPGGFTDNQLDRVYEAARYKAEPEYMYGTVVLERVWELPVAGMTLSTKLTGQLSSENLLGSEQLGFGGFNTVRGYYEREYNADQGLIANVELRSKRYMVGKIGGSKELANYLQFLAFYDYGYARQRYETPHEDTPDFAGVGAGVRYNMGSHISLRFDYAWRLERGYQRNDGSQLHLGVVVSY